MRLLIQRVAKAHVQIQDQIHAQIQQGYLIFIGVEHEDTAEDVEWLASKVAKIRLFADDQAPINADLTSINGDVLVVSQFTLHASTKKGNRPSMIRAARPEQANELYTLFVQRLGALLGRHINTGVFGADMQVHLVNDGPVTIWIDSKNRE